LKENPEVALDTENQIRAKYDLPLAELVKENISNKTKVDKSNEVKDDDKDLKK
jgi:recombination protein RecA